MARKKTEIIEEVKEEVMETEIVEEIKQEEVAIKEKITLKKANELVLKNTELKKDIAGVINRISYVKNEIRKEEFAIKSIEKLKNNRELTEAESELLDKKQLIVAEFNRQLGVNAEKLKSMENEIESNVKIIDDFAMEYSRDILKKQAEVYSKKQKLILDVIGFVNDTINSDIKFAEEDKSIRENISNVIRLSTNIPKFSKDDIVKTMIENNMDYVDMPDVHMREILLNLKNINKYCRRKGI
jgi:hypothetical protein